MVRTPADLAARARHVAVQETTDQENDKQNKQDLGHAPDHTCIRAKAAILAA